MMNVLRDRSASFAACTLTRGHQSVSHHTLAHTSDTYAALARTSCPDYRHLLSLATCGEAPRSADVPTDSAVNTEKVAGKVQYCEPSHGLETVCHVLTTSLLSFCLEGHVTRCEVHHHLGRQ